MGLNSPLKHTEDLPIAVLELNKFCLVSIVLVQEDLESMSQDPWLPAIRIWRVAGDFADS